MTEKRDRPQQRRRAKPLVSDEDHALWDLTTRTMQPLRGVKSRVHRALEGSDSAHATARGSREIEAGNHGGKRSHEEAIRAKPHPAPLASERKSAERKAGPPPLAKFDRNKERGLRSGRNEIDARIDLHGMRQAEAHVALKRFLHQSHAKGCSTVLVITGKGAPSGRPAEDEPFWMGSSSGERGVLRRNVPRWLAEPDLRAIVVSFTEAAMRHGGDGALYVHLRRRLHRED